MQATLGGAHRDSLSWVGKLGEPEADAMVSLAGRMLREGSSQATSKAIATAADKLESAPDRVWDALCALAHLISETARLSLGEQDVNDALGGLGISGDSAGAIARGCAEFSQQARSDVGILGGNFPAYKSSDWRLECLIGTRSIRSISEPSYTIQIETQHKGETSKHMLQAEYATLRDVCTVLKTALQEVDSNHYRKIVKATK